MDFKKIEYQKLLNFTCEIMKGLGYPQSQAEIASKVLVEADARGIPSHGVARLAFYKKNIDGNFTVPEAEPEIVHETPVSVVVDGKSGIGPYISKVTVEKCLEKAQQSGVCFGSVRNSNHFGIAGFWAELAARKDMIGMAFTNTRRCGIVTGGRERLLGTNPIAVAIPRDGGEPFLLDMATTTVAHGKIEVYDRRNKEMPFGWAVDEKGKDTTDAHHIEELFKDRQGGYGGHLYLGGEGEMLGGHKGYGLGLLVELLCAGLSLGRWSKHTFEGEGSGTTHFFAAFRLDLFGNANDIKKHIDSILTDIQNSEKADGYDRIYIHGEKEWENRERAMKEGISLDPATCMLLQDFAQTFNIPWMTLLPFQN